MIRRACVVALLLAGCAQRTPPPAAAVPGTRCDANAVQALLGRPADTVTAEAQRRSGARHVRRYVTGSALTMDFRADRLNVETDPAGTIVRLGCG